MNAIFVEVESASCDQACLVEWLCICHCCDGRQANETNIAGAIVLPGANT